MEIRETDAVLAARWRTLPSGEAIATNAAVVMVSAAEQRALLIRDGVPERAYLISTARAGIGSAENSGKTPLGWHVVTEWVGAGTRPGQVFVGRKPEGGVIPNWQWSDDAGGDKVLTRILRLRGLEEGVNCGRGIDSFSRFIYLHGTNQEHLLGTPASHGCIRFANRDILEVFARTCGRPTYCLILREF